MNIGILGCGFIGKTLATVADEIPEIQNIVVYDNTYVKAQELAAVVGKSRAVDSVEELVEHADLIIEAASLEAIREFAIDILARGSDLMIMSVGALSDNDLWDKMKHSAQASGSRIYIPSGAVAGIDGIRAAAQTSIFRVQLTTIKPPKGLRGAAYLNENGIVLDGLDEPIVVFEGTAREAVKAFPKNVNVAATISLAGVGLDETQVKIIVDPAINRNTHKISAEGRFGSFEFSVSNTPSSTNPRTSYLAALSAIACLKKIVSGIFIG